MRLRQSRTFQDRFCRYFSVLGWVTWRRKERKEHFWWILEVVTLLINLITGVEEIRTYVCASIWHLAVGNHWTASESRQFLKKPGLLVCMVRTKQIHLHPYKESLAKLQNTGPLVFTSYWITIVPIVSCFVLQKILTHVKRVVQSGPAFCSCSSF